MTMSRHLHSAVRYCAYLLMMTLGAPVAAYAKPAEPGMTFRDCPDCPEMQNIAAGTFMMGSTPEELAREKVPEKFHGRELPRHAVTIGTRFAVARTETTRADYARFVQATGRPSGGCTVFDFAAGKLVPHAELSWENPGFAQKETDPVACVSWDDAKAYAAWMSERTGKPYRLLSEAEWEYAARAGTQTPRSWGGGAEAACTYANVYDSKSQAMMPAGDPFASDQFTCTDGYAHTSPVARFKPNAFGLYDMEGNLAEWVEDCVNPGYAGAPTDGSAWLTGNCASRTFRGGSWRNSPSYIRSSARFMDPANGRYEFLTIRLARTMD